MAAISAARAGAAVTVLEHNKQVGKKILVTGNGRCNLTNVNQNLENYRGSNPEFAECVLTSFPMHDTLRLFTELGVFTKNRNGYLYPYSDQASAVADALRMETEHLRVKLAMNTKIEGIVREEGKFLVKTEGWIYEGDTLILAAGSCAAPQTGSDGSGYAYAKAFGHRIIEPLPALVQLCSRDKRFPKLAGLRMDAAVKLFIDGEETVSDTGEVQFTAYGLSGIPVFQVSRFASRALREGKNVEACLDFMPAFSGKEFEAFLDRRIRANAYKSAEQLLVGLFPKKMADCLLETSQVPKGRKAGELDERERSAFVEACRNFRVKLHSTNGFEQAQVCCGGVDTSQVKAPSMESLLVPGLYFAGEILDVDGACGGYNLQWAWSSGYLAGLHAAEGEKE
jgi:hypothetical protein